MKLGDTAKQANELITGDRAQAYGDPKDCYRRCSDIFFEMTDISLSPSDIMLLFIAAKLARNFNAPKDDNMTDIAGYADIWNYLESGDNGQQSESTE